MPAFDLHRSMFPQFRYCRGCFARPVGGTRSEAYCFVIMDAGEVMRAGDKADLQDPALRRLLTV